VTVRGERRVGPGAEAQRYWSSCTTSAPAPRSALQRSIEPLCSTARV
jgi:hypothetical protein